MATLSQIATFYALAKQIFGPDFAKDLLGLFIKRKNLTEEQKTILIADEEDYNRRIEARS